MKPSPSHVLVVLALLSAGCNGRDPQFEESGRDWDTPVGFSYSVVEPGSGEPNTAPLWPLTPGSYGDGVFVVHEPQGAVIPVSFNAAPNFLFGWERERWQQDADGMGLVGRQGEEEVRVLLLPNEVRDGAEWVSNQLTVTAQRLGPLEEFGGREAWSIAVASMDFERVFVEGIGPAAPGRSAVVVVERAESGPLAWEAGVEEDANFLLRTTKVTGVDVSGQPYMVMHKGRSEVSNGGVSVFTCELRTDSGWEAGERTYDVDKAVIFGPTLSGCPYEYQAGEEGFFSDAAQGLPTSEGIYWFDRGMHAPHFGVDGQVLARSGGVVATSVVEHAGIEGVDTLGASFDPFDMVWGEPNYRIGLDFETTQSAGRLVAQKEGWVTPASMVGSHIDEVGVSWFAPARTSEMLTDSGRSVYAVHPEGRVFELDVALEAAGPVLRRTLRAQTRMDDFGRAAGALPDGDDVMVFPEDAQVVRTAMLDEDRPYSPARALRGTWLPPEQPGLDLALQICAPPGTVLSALDVQVAGVGPSSILEPPKADGCGLLMFPATTARSAVQLTLPGVGPVELWPAAGFAQPLPDDAVPTRDGGFTVSYEKRDALGRRAHGLDYQRTRHADPSGLGGWQGLDISSLRPDDGTTTRPGPPFKPTSSIHGSTPVWFVSGRGSAFACGELSAGGEGCLELLWSGDVAPIERSELESSEARLIAQLDDGTLCFASVNELWCGSIHDRSAAVTFTSTPEDVIPLGSGLYFRSGPFTGTAPYAWFDASTGQLSDAGEWRSLVRVSDDEVMAVQANDVYALQGLDQTRVFQGTDPSGMGAWMSLQPGRDTVFVYGHPFPLAER